MFALASPSQWRAHASIKLAPPRQRVGSPIGLLGLVADDMGERMLGKFAREVRFVAGPITE